MNVTTRLCVLTLATPLLGACAAPQPRDGTPADSLPADEYSVCCVNFPETLAGRVYPVLSADPEVSGLHRVRADDGLLCYRLRFAGPVEELEARLGRQLRTGTTRPFKVRRLGDGRELELTFDGGFD